MELKEGQEVYWTRILKKLKTYDLYDLTVRKIEDTWFSTFDKKTKQSYIFSKSDIGKVIFFNRSEALEKIKDEELKD